VGGLHVICSLSAGSSLLSFVSLVCSGVRASQTGMKNMRAKLKMCGS